MTDMQMIVQQLLITILYPEHILRPVYVWLKEIPYAYLVSLSGSKGYCWPSIKTIVRDTGIGKTSVQEALKILKKRQIISVSKHRKPYGFSNNEYTLLSLDNPEVYRDLDEANELPFAIDDNPAA